MNIAQFKKSGHWPTLATAFLYFDVSFMVWTMLGALGALIAPDLGLNAQQKFLMVSTPILSGAVLRKLAPTVLTAEINPDDATRLGISAGDRVTVRSRRGTAEAIALVTPTVQSGQIFLPMHFGTVNQLTFPSFDPHSRQPSYKACAVAVARLE